MLRGNKLGVLLRTYEAAEKDAAHEQRRVSDIVAERRRVVEELRSRHSALSEKVSALIGAKRPEALRTGNVSQITTISAYTGRLHKELAQIEEHVKVKEEELQRAVERAQLAQDELVSARVEKKKLEQLIEAQRRISARQDLARSEAAADELNTFRRKDKS